MYHKHQTDSGDFECLHFLFYFLHSGTVRKCSRKYFCLPCLGFDCVQYCGFVQGVSLISACCVSPHIAIGWLKPPQLCVRLLHVWSSSERCCMWCLKIFSPLSFSLTTVLVLVPSSILYPLYPLPFVRLLHLFPHHCIPSFLRCQTPRRERARPPDSPSEQHLT